MVDIQPDGDLMFDAGALWVAAKYEIPMLVVMHNNRAYYNDWEHQIRMARLRGTDEAKAHIGMDMFGPEPDFAALARSMGCYGEGPIDNPQDVRPALRARLAEVKKGRARAGRHHHAAPVRLALRLAFFLLPAQRGEGGEPRSGEADERLFQYPIVTRAPHPALTSFGPPSPRSAGRGKLTAQIRTQILRLS